MDKLSITGGRALSGRLRVSGAKNSALPILAGTLLTDEPVVIANAPHLHDVTTMIELLGCLGADVVIDEKLNVEVCAAHLESHRAPYELVKTMRASFLVLGPLLARHGRATVSLPGGCAIGARPMDLHIEGLEALGASIELRDGYLHAEARSGLKGAQVTFGFASVGATENVMMAATLAKGTTVLNNAAREPEIVDLATCLRAMGAEIEGDGTSTITIQGVDRLHGATHPVVTDRIELGTYMLVPAICGGEVECLGGRLSLVEAFCEKLDAAGIEVSETGAGLKVARKNGRVRAVDVTTEPFPGFPTDLQAQFMALMCTADGTSVLEEKIFENRFMHAPELTRMGAEIEVHGGTATVTGVERLKGAPVMATDLRASVSLILAGLAAEGETVVNRVYHLDRGYERVEEKLRNVGALIERVQAV